MLTHGHGDHFGQTIELLTGTSARLIASSKLCDFVGKKFDEQRLLTIEPDDRLTVDAQDVLAVKATHRYGLEEFGGDVLGFLAYGRYTPWGTNMGFLISSEGRRIYHSGDTHVVRDILNPDVAFLSMDGVRTLNEKEAMEVISRINPKLVVPIHYKWHENGAKGVSRVKEAVKERVPFREMTYGEVLSV
jgi:L-ascorbate metabolism protein UlaG (beta-lactamase superfamily)